VIGAPANFKIIHPSASIATSTVAPTITFRRYGDIAGNFYAAGTKVARY
jgi:hypothetical protein